MGSKDWYRVRARDIVKQLRAERKVTYAQLARLLKMDDGVAIDTQALINRINRGNFSFAFVLRLMTALDIEDLHVPKERGPHETSK